MIHAAEYNLVATRNVGLDTAQDVLSKEVSGRQWVLGYAGDDGSGSTKDTYRVTLAAGKKLELETTLPATGSGEFVNNLDPMVRVYDPSGNRVASNDNSGPDKRNAKLNYKVPTGKVARTRSRSCRPISRPSQLKANTFCRSREPPAACRPSRLWRPIRPMGAACVARQPRSLWTLTTRCC